MSLLTRDYAARRVMSRAAYRALCRAENGFSIGDFGEFDGRGGGHFLPLNLTFWCVLQPKNKYNNPLDMPLTREYIGGVKIVMFGGWCEGWSGEGVDLEAENGDRDGMWRE